ncbi:MAG: hypothetical protein NC206_11415 [Bacteroides sp.]|nr:hypothetical protein [Roseburia sp.]MCM1347676.1 hypothetical protein [Bacteroides sp.]MCM1422109.1 hypothetical protein [Bacteroides sp.]
MKKVWLGTIALLFASMCVTSCMDDDDVKASAEMTYFGESDTIAFYPAYESSADSLMYDTLVRKSLDEIGYTGGKSVFTEKAEVTVSIPVYAQAKCNEQAIKTYEANIKDITLDEVKEKIYEKNWESVKEKYPNAAAIPVRSFTVDLKLYSLSYELPLKKYTKQLK